MEKQPGTVPETPKESADDLAAINEEQEDDSGSTPGDEEESSGPSVGEVFRSGS